jgi:hypothetical protein
MHDMDKFDKAVTGKCKKECFHDGGWWERACGHTLDTVMGAKMENMEPYNGISDDMEKWGKDILTKFCAHKINHKDIEKGQ